MSDDVRADLILRQSGGLKAEYASLARELVQNIRPVKEVLSDYGFSGPDDPAYEELQRSRDFIEILMQIGREWNAVDSTPKRIRFKALASMEIMLAELHVIAMTHPNMEHRMTAMKMIKDISGFSQTGGIGGAGGIDNTGGFNLKIVIGGTTITADLTQPKVLDAKPITIEGES